MDGDQRGEGRDQEGELTTAGARTGRRSDRPLPGPGEPAPAPRGDLAYAADLFDAGRARDAHEEWEVAWRALPRDSADAWFLKGLLCASAWVVKHAEGSPGAPVLRDRTIAAFSESPVREGLRGDEVVARIDAWVRGGPWPSLP